MSNIYVVYDVVANKPVAGFTVRYECMGWLLHQNILNSLVVHIITDGPDPEVKTTTAVEFCHVE